MWGRGTFFGIFAALLDRFLGFWDIFAVWCRYKGSNARCKPYRDRLFRYWSTLKFQGEGKTAVISAIFSFHIVGVVAYLSTFSNPSDSFVQCVPIWVDQWLHAYVVEAVRLKQVDNIEPILYIFPGISYWKEVPLGMAVGVVVSGKDQIVLIFGSS